tara:strand:- start:27612 stop:29426 length:1815 start_codon:yes stop_codon:yes gene_type:complete
MGIFTGAGIADGMLQWGDRNERRRGEVAKLFETYKQNNPYASASDYNQYLEQVVGPKDFFIRGSLPAQDIINKMGADNQEKKRRDDYGKNLDYAAKNMAVNNQIQQYVDDQILNMSDSELQNSLTNMLSNGNSELESQSRETAIKGIGNYQQRKDRKLKEMYEAQLKKGIDILNSSNGAIDISDLMNGNELGGLPNSFLEGYKDQLQTAYTNEQNRLSENQEKKRTAGFFGVRNKFETDEMLRSQVASGSKGYNSVKESIIQQLTAVDTGGKKMPPAEIDKMAESILKDMQIRQDYTVNKYNINARNKALENITAGFEAKSDLIKEMLQASTGDLDELKQGAARLALIDIDMTPQQASSLAEFIRNNSFKTPQQGYKLWKDSLTDSQKSQLNKVSNRFALAQQQANSMYPDSETVNDLVQGFEADMQVDGAQNQSLIEKFKGQLFSEFETENANGVNNLKGLKSALERSQIAVKNQIMYKLENPSRWIKGSDAFTEQKAMELIASHNDQAQQLIDRIDAILRPPFKNATQQQDANDPTTITKSISLKGQPYPTKADVDRIFAAQTADITKKLTSQEIFRMKSEIADGLVKAWNAANRNTNPRKQ